MDRGNKSPMVLSHASPSLSPPGLMVHDPIPNMLRFEKVFVIELATADISHVAIRIAALLLASPLILHLAPNGALEGSVLVTT